LTCTYSAAGAPTDHGPFAGKAEPPAKGLPWSGGERHGNLALRMGGDWTPKSWDCPAPPVQHQRGEEEKVRAI